MAKSPKAPVQKKPVRARGAVPVPRQAPKRSNKVWYQRRLFQVLAGILVVIFVALVVKLILDWRKDVEAKADRLKTVEQFERAAQLLQGNMSQVFEGMNKAPTEFKDGKLSAEDFKAQTEIWLTRFRELDSGLRKRRIPSNVTSLEEARAMMVQGAMVYIDAAKSFQLAASLTDPAARDSAITQGNNLIHHANSVYGMGQRRLQQLKTSYGGEGGEDLLGPIQLPSEDAPPPPPPGQQGVPGGTGTP